MTLVELLNNQRVIKKLVQVQSWKFKAVLNKDKVEINNLDGSDSGADPNQFELSGNMAKKIGEAYVIPEGLLSHQLGPHVDKIPDDARSADSYYISQLDGMSNNTRSHQGGRKSHHKLLGSVHSMHSEATKPKSDNGAMDHELA
jgi:hypothetical protein